MAVPATDNAPVPGNRRQRAVLATVVAVAALVGVLSLLGWGLRAVEEDAPLDSGAAPDFTLTSFEGRTISLSELRGQVVVINIWASWCAPCRDEAGYLERTWRQYKERGVFFIGVDYADSEEGARAFLEEFGITYFNGPDLYTRIARAYRIAGVPETFFVAKDGELRGVKIGPLMPPELERKLDELLAEPDPTD